MSESQEIITCSSCTRGNPPQTLEEWLTRQLIVEIHGRTTYMRCPICKEVIVFVSDHGDIDLGIVRTE